MLTKTVSNKHPIQQIQPIQRWYKKEVANNGLMFLFLLPRPHQIYSWLYIRSNRFVAELFWCDRFGSHTDRLSEWKRLDDCDVLTRWECVQNEWLQLKCHRGWVAVPSGGIVSCHTSRNSYTIVSSNDDTYMFICHWNANYLPYFCRLLHFTIWERIR